MHRILILRKRTFIFGIVWNGNWNHPLGEIIHFVLFAKERHPHPASFYKDEWAFIEDKGVRENIAYQLQYLEFMIRLYNDYQFYLTTESLLCKDIMEPSAASSLALFDLIQSAKHHAGLPMAGRTDFHPHFAPQPLPLP